MTDTLSWTPEGRPHTRRAVNFSRPRPVTTAQKLRRDHDSWRGDANIYEGLYDSNQAPLPVELPADVPAQALDRARKEVPADKPAQPDLVELPAELPAELSAELPAEMPSTLSLPIEHPSESHFSLHTEISKPISFFFPAPPPFNRRNTMIDSSPSHHHNALILKTRRRTYEGDWGQVPAVRSLSSSPRSTLSDSTLSSHDSAAAAPSIPRAKIQPDPRTNIFRRLSRLPSGKHQASSTTSSSMASSPRTSHEISIPRSQHSHPLRSHPPGSHRSLPSSPIDPAPPSPSPPPRSRSRSISNTSYPLDNNNNNSTSDRNSTIDNNKWTSSDFDISDLSPAELQKLAKKGINPALYAEMKAARKGKGKWGLGLLGGNLFLG